MEVVKYPNDVLRKNAEKVTRFDTELFQMAMSMIETMVKSGGIGLAANQVGITKQIIVMYRNPEKSLKPDFIVLINPEITHASSFKTPLEEGCLSFPGERVNVLRPSTVTVKYQELNGNTKTSIFSGLPAKCVQHEMEHLQGVLMIDYKENKENP